ncbi:hypothetical protein PR202_ga07722 [Eleusine coracana subsp. coracana]|uniref:Strictosidine synthase conserved region domain-containing protein n=1 Tax=Eleusine coracana subsp. coracana TaxID=191504 RepID=A0AAV5C1E9_ELECO|nr:hypothetical protein QOZ80_2AG0115400 [Eleusine coracana subsp. coracana]GJM91359.1 hypothetical protein PR202_ga07722 [Eleusine coracana subsp. coracana]
MAAAGLRFVKAVALVLAPVLLAAALYNPDDFSPAPMPPEYSYGPVVTAPRHEARVLQASERVGEGRLPGPEDLAYDAAGGWLYTGCADRWVRRVSVPGGDVEDWARTGGRPLGVVLAADGGLVVADADIGLLKVSPVDGKVELLTDTAEGVKFKLADGVDVAADGNVYFTDASYKYNLANHMTDVLEARPHGRLLSFDPATGKTAVLARDLYFANGVAVAPDQRSLVYCETPMRRCSRYHIAGDKKGTVEKFIDNLLGFPDNIRYDGEGLYWIALSAGRTLQWDMLTKYPFIRKLVYLVEKFVALPHGLKNSGGMSVTLDGEPVSFYSDPGLALATGWLKVGNHLYYGSLVETYLSRIDLTKSSAESSQE